MIYNKIINVADPEDDTDAINKKYVDERELNLYAIGRYIVISKNNGNNIYFSVRTKINIDLESGISFGMISSGEGDNLFDIINGDHRYVLSRDFDKNNFTLGSTNISKPWTMLFSLKPKTFSKLLISCPKKIAR